MKRYFIDFQLLFLLVLLVEDYHACKEKPIELNVDNADIILTGTVRKLERNYSLTQYGAYVEVHRIIKGSHLIYDVYNTIIENPYNFEMQKNLSKRTNRQQNSINGHIIFIYNFGDTRICDSKVNPNDVRIFLLGVDVYKRLHLNSSLIQPTLTKARNLNTVSENELTYDIKMYTKCSQSVSNLCNFGSTCMINIMSNLITCECDINCEMVNEMNLCGNDGVTYSSLCHLKQTKCLQQRSIKIINHNSCDQLEKSLCKSKACPNYSRCKIDENGFYAKCYCPYDCDVNDLNTMLDMFETPINFTTNMINIRTDQTVCGTNGKDYTNFCELQRESCKENNEIKIAYVGKCDPCAESQCMYPEICRLNVRREPVCVCNYQCSLDFKPVCGTDGKTYINECYMRLESCRLNRPIKVYQPVECSLINNPCDEMSCEQYIGSYCEIVPNGNAFCKCEQNCEKRLSHVCGSDGITYENECTLKRESCLANSQISVTHVGICGNINPCIDQRCNFNGVCKVINDAPVCQCETCPDNYKPVCGSNGVTYNNECKLRSDACSQQTFIMSAYEGPCDKCKSINCPNYGICIDDGYTARCTCPESCAEVDLPVCGSNGLTYRSVCHLQLESCRNQETITIEHSGKCDTCLKAKCDTPPYNYVCGSNGITYPNECFLKSVSCITKTNLTIEYKGPCKSSNRFLPKLSCEDCKFDAECTVLREDGTFRCSCSKFECVDFPKNLICGSNGYIYANKCELDRDQCLKQREIKERPLTSCMGQERNEPCNGLLPLIDHYKGGEFECLSNSECPTESYCDRVHSKCCSKRPQLIPTNPLRCEKTSDCLGEHMICISSTCISISNCLNSTFGCCDDGFTPAQGLNKENCPQVCNCHPAGSYNHYCDPLTGQCPCRPGVVGRLCDSCTIGYWGIKKILDSKYVGCLPCMCNKWGSIREDCDQEDGKCECKPGVSGPRCTDCPANKELTQDGCVSIVENQQKIVNLCSSIYCNYPGAYCSVEDGVPKCVCDAIQCISDNIKVCGEDGQTYASLCDLYKFSCAKKTRIDIVNYGQCSQTNLIPSINNNLNNKNNANNRELNKRPRNKSISTNVLLTTKLISDDFLLTTTNRKHSHSRTSTTTSITTTATSSSTSFSSTNTENNDNDDDNSYETENDKLVESSTIPVASLSSSIQFKSNKLFILLCLLFNETNNKYLIKITSQDLKNAFINTEISTTFIPYGTQKCKKDYDCGKNMECLENICYCNENFYPAPGNNYCTRLTKNSNNSKRFVFDACKSKPCRHESFCESLSQARYKCHCPLSKHGPFCELDYDSLLYPHFKNYSYLEVNSSLGTTLNDFTIQIEFKPFKINGLVFFASQFLDGTGNLIAIILRDGFIEIKIDNSVDDFRTYVLPISIKIGKFHELFIQKNKNVLLMQLDDYLPFQENISNSPIQLNERIVLGDLKSVTRLKTNLVDKLIIDKGFEGCLQYLKLNDKVLNISFPSNDILNGVDIEECADEKCLKEKCLNNGRCKMWNDFSIKAIKTTCVCESKFSGEKCEIKENPCFSSPCRMNSTCIPTSSGSFQCICSDKFSGKLCDTKVKLKAPFIGMFHVRSFIEKQSQDINIIYIVFLSHETNGILMYMNLDTNDFIGIKIENSYIHFVYYLNGVYENLISRNPITTQYWHELRIVKEKSRFKMYIDSDNVIISTDILFLPRFNENESLFIGGVKESSKINRRFKSINGLHGAIQTISFNNENLKDIRMNAIELSGITEYNGYPCNHTLCQNNSICIPLINKFKCLCSNGYSGNYCEIYRGRRVRQKIVHKSRNFVNHHYYSKKNESFDALYLDGHTELLYKNRIFEMIKVQTSNKFELTFKTKSLNGLILYIGKGDSYLIIGFQNGKLIYSFSLSKHKQTFNLVSPTKLNDNKWHTITIERNKRRTLLNIDFKHKLNGTFDEINYVGYGNLLSDGYLRVGGWRRLPSGFSQPFYQGFQGCLSELKVDERLIDLVRHNLNLDLIPIKCSDYSFKKARNSSK